VHLLVKKRIFNVIKMHGTTIKIKATLILVFMGLILCS